MSEAAENEANLREALAWTIHRAYGCGPVVTPDGPGPVCGPDWEDYKAADEVLAAYSVTLLAPGESPAPAP